MQERTKQHENYQCQPPQMEVHTSELSQKITAIDTATIFQGLTQHFDHSHSLYDISYSL